MVDLTNLVPLIVGAAVLPLWIIITLLLLRGGNGGNGGNENSGGTGVTGGKGGVMKAAAFASGAMGVRLIQGVLFGVVFRAAGEQADQSERGVIASLLLLVVGVVMLITALRTWLRKSDADAPPPPPPPPKWMARINNVSAITAMGMGAAYLTISIKQWVFTLSAIAVIYEASLDQVHSAMAYVVFVIAAQSIVLALIIGSAIAPRRAANVLDAMQGWLERNNRLVTIIASLVFGAWFVSKGAADLIFT